MTGAQQAIAAAPSTRIAPPPPRRPLPAARLPTPHRGCRCFFSRGDRTVVGDLLRLRLLLRLSLRHLQAGQLGVMEWCWLGRAAGFAGALDWVSAAPATHRRLRLSSLLRDLDLESPPMS